MLPHARRILVIDEEPTLLEITAFRLELLGHVVDTVQTGDEALEALSQRRPDLVAVGQVADVDAIEFLNRLSDDANTSDIPFLYMSSSSDLEEVQRAFNAGADEYLVTPYDPLVLEKKVSELLSVEVNASEY